MGENLSYTNEKMEKSLTSEFINSSIDDLLIVIIENSDYCAQQLVGIDDNEFIRVEKVPMTKSVVRAVLV